MPIRHAVLILIGLFVLIAVEPVYGGQTLSEQVALTAIQAAMSTATPTSEAPNRWTFTGMSSVSFIDSQRGWMLSNYRINGKNMEAVTVDSTTDAGRTWQFLSTLNIVVFSDSGQPISAIPEPSISGIRFADAQDGWVFGPSLLSTHDGGRTWKHEPIPGDIEGLTVVGTTVWALQGQGTCSSGYYNLFQCDKIMLLTSKDKGLTWQSHELPSKLIEIGDFAVVDSQTAWIVGSEQDGSELFSITDGGETVHRVENPDPICAGEMYDEIAAVDKQNLWLACGDSGAGNNGGKRILTSLDGGQSWQLKAWATMGPLPDDTMTGIGWLNHIYAFSPQSAWLTLGRNCPIVTTDGGKTWQTMVVIQNCDNSDDQRVTWVDPSHVWFYTRQNLFYTTDGGSTWILERDCVVC